MAEYLFNFDIHNAGSNVYTEIEELLKKNDYTVLDHPLGSTYLIQKDEINIRSLCEELETVLSDYDAAFILSRYDKQISFEGATEKRKRNRRQLEKLEEIEKILGK